MADIAALTAEIEARAEALGLSVVRVVMLGGTSDPTLQVMAERPDTRQLTLDDCATLSRSLSAWLDALEEAGHDPIEGAYRLEVSSPGIDRPLTRLADYADWAGHEARIRLLETYKSRKQFEGVLLGVDGDNVKLDAVNVGAVSIPFDIIRTAKLLLTDKLIKATAPLNADGADKIKVEG
jgi:ribosome maturation factor RimP